MNNNPPPRHPIACEFEGKTHKGIYWVAGKILIVATGGGGNSRQVGTMEPQDLAVQLLLELVRAGKGYAHIADDTLFSAADAASNAMGAAWTEAKQPPAKP
jgi:hypothetical protein